MNLRSGKILSVVSKLVNIYSPEPIPEHDINKLCNNHNSCLCAECVKYPIDLTKYLNYEFSPIELTFDISLLKLYINKCNSPDIDRNEKFAIYIFMFKYLFHHRNILRLTEPKLYKTTLNKIDDLYTQIIVYFKNEVITLTETELILHFVLITLKQKFKEYGVETNLEFNNLIF